MPTFRKRVFASAFRSGSNGIRSRPMKRRRFVRRRGLRRMQQSNTITTQSGVGKSLLLKSRKISRRRWNNLLWTSTLQKSHYRSAGATSGFAATQVSNTVWTVNTEQALDNGLGPFWTTAGGTVALDQGVTVPLFRGDIVLRGGKVGISIYNDSTSGPIECWVMLIKAAPRFTVANLPPTPPVGWDPSMTPEFTKDIGRIVYSRKFMLENQATGGAERRLPIQKIDQESWTTDQQRWYWITLVRDFDPVDQNVVRIVTYFNVSFSGDAIGTT